MEISCATVTKSMKEEAVADPNRGAVNKSDKTRVQQEGTKLEIEFESRRVFEALSWTL